MTGGSVPEEASLNEARFPEGQSHQPPPAEAWHAIAAEEALKRLETGKNGLSAEEAARRLARHGPNRLTPPAGRSALWRFAAQFNNILILVLIAAAAVSALLGEIVDAAVIVGVVAINAAIGFIQEGKAEQALNAIRSMLSLNASAVRDGKRRTIPAEELVPGDLVHLASGDRVPADLRLISSRNLQVEELALTGESVPVQKSVEPVAAGRGARRPDVLGMVGNAGDDGAGDRGGGRHGRRHRDRPDQHHDRRRRDDGDAAAGADGGLRPLADRRHPGARGSRLRGRRLAARPSHDRDVHGGRRHRGGRHPGRPARRHDHHAGDRRHPHGPAQRDHPPAARRRDAGFGQRHLLRQDRHPDPQRADGAPGRDGGGRVRRRRHRLRARGRLRQGRCAGHGPRRRSGLAGDRPRRPAVQRRGAQRPRRRLAGGRRPDRRRAAGAGAEGGAGSGGNPAGLSPAGRDPVRIGTQVHGDAAPYSRWRGPDLRQGRSGTPCRDGGGRAARRWRRADRCRRLDRQDRGDGGAGAAGAGGGLPRRAGWTGGT